MSIELIGLALVPLLLYMIWKKYYLNQSQFALIISSLLMLLALLFDSWITYVAYLILGGWQMITLFSMSKLTYFFDRNKSTHKFSHFTVFFFSVEEQEIMLFLYAIVVWIWVRVQSLKSLDFVFNGGTFLTLLKGWNCTLGQFWWINSLWMSLSFLSGYACNFLIRNEYDKNNLYKSYLYKYKVVMDQICLALVTVYHLFVYANADKLEMCLLYMESGLIIRLIWFWGMPLSTIIFLLKKNGEFSIEQQSSDRTQKQNELEQQLNRMQIDRQHSKISNRSGKQGKRQGVK